MRRVGLAVTIAAIGAFLVLGVACAQIRVPSGRVIVFVL